jgi:uncharacterized membrane protein YfcA
VKPEPLNYATPSKKHKRSFPVLAIIFGALSGLVGIVALYFGITGISWLVHDWETVDARDVSAVLCFTLIGAICSFACIRWIRSAFRDGFDSWSG